MLRLLPMLLLLVIPAAHAQDGLLDRALTSALDTFEKAWPSLGATDFGVDSAAYRDALGLQQFQSAHWGGTIQVDVATTDAGDASCARFAAYTRLPPEAGTVRLVLCPQFFTPGADGLRELTILHEMVHAVAGKDECQAMAYAARVEVAARGQFTPVDGYWAANGCEGSGYALPR